MDKSVLRISQNLPSVCLQETCLIKIITNLCNDPQLLGLILNCDFIKDVRYRLMVKDQMQWKAVLAMVNELFSQICSSFLIRKKLHELIWPVSHRIILWKSVYAPNIANRFLQRFYWTDRGRIDTTRTARHIIRNKNIPIRMRFVLASSAALREELTEIWSEMSYADREFFLTENTEKTCPLTLFWARNFGQLYDDFYENIHEALECATENGMLEAVKFLSSMSRENVIESTAEVYMPHLSIKLLEGNRLEEDENDVAFFLFFEMNDDEQDFWFNDNTSLVLSLLLHTSNYDLCFKLLEERLPSQSEEDFLIYLSIIFFNYHLEVDTDEGCRILFTKVWQMLPTSMKKAMICSDLRAELPALLIRDYFPFLLEKSRIEAFKKIKEFTKLDLISRYSNNPSDFHEGKWQLLQFFIKEEITAISWLTTYKKDVLDLLGEKFRYRSVWMKILKFVLNVKEEKKLQQKKYTKRKHDSLFRYISK